MARIIPDGWRELSVTGAAQREIETLAVLADGLPDEYSVYHAVHWTGMDGRYAIYGEIDFAVVESRRRPAADRTEERLSRRNPGWPGQAVPRPVKERAGADLAHGQQPARQARGPRRHSLGAYRCPALLPGLHGQEPGDGRSRPRAHRRCRPPRPALPDHPAPVTCLARKRRPPQRSMPSCAT